MKKYNKFLSKLIIAILIVAISFTTILPTSRMVYAADEEEQTHASLIERVVSAFIVTVSVGTYALVTIVAGEPISVESLIFNGYNKTRLTFFEDPNVEPNQYLVQGGEGSIINVITDYFNFFTKIAIVAYLIILVYMGIRILLGTGAAKGAKYKELFMYWIQGVLILFVFPYVIKYTIMANDAFIDFIYQNKTKIQAMASANANDYNASSPKVNENNSLVSIDSAVSETTSYLKDENNQDYMSVMFRLAWTEGWFVYALCWAVMVKQLIGLLIIYFKRLLTTIFLIAIFPLVTISYAIDKIGDGKSQAFGNWYKEFALNVFLQSFQAIVYVIGMALILTLGEATNTPLSDHWLLIILILSFIAKGDDMLKVIFNMKGGGADSVKSIGKTMLQVKGATELVKGATSAVSNKFGSHSHVGGAIREMSNAYGHFQDMRTSRNNMAVASYVPEQEQPPEASTAGGNINSSNGPSNPDNSAPMTIEDYAAVAIDENATDEERAEALNNVMKVLNSNDENAKKALMKYLKAHPNALIVAGITEVELKQKIEIMLEEMKRNAAYSKLARSRQRTPREEQKFKNLSRVKFKKPDQAKATSKTKTANRGAKKSDETQNNKGAANKYSGAFVPAGRRQKATKRHAKVWRESKNQTRRTMKRDVVNEARLVNREAKIQPSNYEKLANQKNTITRYRRVSRRFSEKGISFTGVKNISRTSKGLSVKKNIAPVTYKDSTEKIKANKEVKQKVIKNRELKSKATLNSIQNQAGSVRETRVIQNTRTAQNMRTTQSTSKAVKYFGKRPGESGRVRMTRVRGEHNIIDNTEKTNTSKVRRINVARQTLIRPPRMTTEAIRKMDITDDTAIKDNITSKTTGTSDITNYKSAQGDKAPKRRIDTGARIISDIEEVTPIRKAAGHKKLRRSNEQEPRTSAVVEKLKEIENNSSVNEEIISPITENLQGTRRRRRPTTPITFSEDIMKAASKDNIKEPSKSVTKIKGYSKPVTDELNAIEKENLRTVNSVIESINVINQTDSGEYTVSEVLTHIDNIKRVRYEARENQKDNPKLDTEIQKALKRLNYNLYDYESNLRIQVLNDPSLISEDDPNRMNIINSSIKRVKKMKKDDDILIYTLRHNPDKLVEDQIPIVRKGDAEFEIRTPEEESKFQSALAASLKEKERHAKYEAAEKSYQKAKEALGKDALNILKNAAGATVDITVGLPVELVGGMMLSGAASGTKDGELITLKGATNALAGYTMTEKAYDNITKPVEQKISAVASTIGKKLEDEKKRAASKKNNNTSSNSSSSKNS